MKTRLPIVLTLILLACAGPLSAAQLISSAADPALNGASLIEFDDQSTGTFLQRTIDSVQFYATGQSFFVIQSANIGGVYGDTGLSLQNQAVPYPAQFAIEFVNSPVSALGFTWGGAGYDWEMAVFSPTNVELLRTTILAVPAQGYLSYAGAKSPGMPIERIELTQINGGPQNEPDWIKLDHFAYVPVPEATSLALMAIGCFVWLCGRARGRAHTL